MRSTEFLCVVSVYVRVCVISQAMGNELTHEMTMTDFTPLDVDEMVMAYKQSKSRVILFDYGGSLLEKEVLELVQHLIVVNKLLTILLAWHVRVVAS